MPVDLRLLTAFDGVEEMAAIIPLGSVEQHCRLPAGLDCMIAERLSWLSAGRAEEMLGRSPVYAIAPPICYGFSPEWAGVKGTITLPANTLLNLLEAVIGGLAGWGFNPIIILNAHAGNTPIARAAAAEQAYKRGAPRVAVIDYWRHANLTLGHACSVEESLALQLGIIKEPPGREGCTTSRKHPAGLIGGTLDKPSWLPGGQPPKLEEVVEALARTLKEALRYNIEKHYI
jgi:creatinine amidohydrolase/Fe(II)-dependent formamide hydrolase-like protein